MARTLLLLFVALGGLVAWSPRSSSAAPGGELPAAVPVGEAPSAAAPDGPARTEAPAVEPLTRRPMTLEKVYRALWYAGRRATYAPTTRAERRAFRRLLPALVVAARTPAPDLAGHPRLAALQELARKARFRLQEWEVEGRTYWALLERPRHARGAGAYVLRVGPPDGAGREVVLQAPHPYFDRHTGVLAARLFFTPPDGVAPRAFLTSTVQRYRGTREDDPLTREGRPKRAATDVCHNRRHLFLTASDAVAHTLGRAVFVQLHGYADASLGDRPDGPVDAIVSAGIGSGSTPTSAAVAWAIADVLGPSVRRFPEDIRRLGGTRNVIGRRLARYPEVDFVHLELAYGVRRRLRRDPGLLVDFGRAALEAAARPQAPWPGATHESPPVAPAEADVRLSPARPSASLQSTPPE